MFEQVKKLIGHSAIYGVAVVASTTGTMILTPLFLHRLVRAEYGMNEVLNVFAQMLFIISNLGIAAVFIKVYVNDCKDEQDRKLMASSMVFFAAGIAVLIALISFIVAKPASSLLFQKSGYGHLVKIAATAGGIHIVLSMIMQSLRAKQWAVKFITMSLFQFGSVVVLNVYFLVWRNMGVLGIQLSALISICLTVCVGLFMLRSEIVPRFSMRVVRYVLLLALPVFPSHVAPWVLNASDRYFLSFYCGLADTGLYAAGYKIGMVGMYAIITATQYAWPPIFYANSDSNDLQRLCAVYLKYYLALLAAAGLFFSIFAPEILRLISSEQYWSAHWIVPYVAAAYVFHGVQFYTIPFYIRANKGVLISAIMGGAAVAKLGINFILVPKYGLSGAVVSTLSIFALETILSIAIAMRFFRVPYEYANLAKLTVLTLLVYFVFGRLSVVLGPSLLVKALSLPVLAAALLATGFLGDKEWAALRKLRPQLGKAA